MRESRKVSKSIPNSFGLRTLLSPILDLMNHGRLFWIKVMKSPSIILLVAIGCFLQVAVFAQTNEVLIAQAKDAIEKSDYVPAISNLNIVLKRSPNNEAALTQRARAYVRQRKFAEGSVDVTKVLAKSPNNYEALNVRGVIKRDSGKDFAGALADFTKALDLKPDFYLATINIGFTNLIQNKINDALKSFSKAIELEPNNPTAYGLRGKLFSDIDSLQEAIADLDKAISLNGKSDNDLATRAMCHFKMYTKGSETNYEFARADADKAILLNPNNALALGIRSLFKVDANDLLGANADADRALQLNPNSYLSYVTKGFIKSNTKLSDGTFDKNGALEEFDKAHKIAPNSAWIIQNRYEVARHLTTPLAERVKEEYKKNSVVIAKAEVEKAKQKVDANPWDYAEYEKLDKAFRRAGSIDAKDYWETLVAKNPNNICAVRFLGEYRRDKYVSFLEQGLALYDGANGTECAAQIALSIGIYHYDTKRYVGAKRYFDKAKTLKPDLYRLDGYITWNENELEDLRVQERVETGISKEAQKRRDEALGEYVEKSNTRVEMAKAFEKDRVAVNKYLENYNSYRAELAKITDYDTRVAERRRVYPLMKKEMEAALATQTAFLAKYESIAPSDIIGSYKTNISNFKAEIEMIDRFLATIN